VFFSDPKPAAMKAFQDVGTETGRKRARDELTPQIEHSHSAADAETGTGRGNRPGHPGRLPAPSSHRSGLARQRGIRLFILLRYAATQAVNHSGAGQTVTLLQSSEPGPRHGLASASPSQLASSDPSRCLPEFQETVEVSNNPVIAVVASRLLRELLGGKDTHCASDFPRWAKSCLASTPPWRDDSDLAPMPVLGRFPYREAGLFDLGATQLPSVR
jgi:hypothetical protein